MKIEDLHIKGLSTEEVIESRNLYGNNKISIEKKNHILTVMVDVLSEPMILLLLAAAFIYFVTGHSGDAIFMIAAIILVAAISIFQDHKSKTALEHLKELIQPDCKVIRDGKEDKIPINDLVIHDVAIVEEGGTIPADGKVLNSYDFTVNESLLTGESLSVAKSSEDDVYRGTQVSSGMAVIKVSAIGDKTQIGKIGIHLKEIKREPSLLQIQINRFVKGMVIIGTLFFILVWVLNFLKSNDALDSLLKALTMAMSVLPEEIPVAFTTFMAIGAYRLMNMGVIVKDVKTVETLGMADVICADKTGTLTINQMKLARIYALNSSKVVSPQEALNDSERKLIEMAMWASEPLPYDPMEKSIHDTYSSICIKDRRNDYKMIHEYPLEGTPPMMTHIYGNKKSEIITAAKGGLESIIACSDLTTTQINEITNIAEDLSNEGYRILGVAHADLQNTNFPTDQREINFSFLGLIAFYDPPKDNISSVITAFKNAGIRTKIITGDNKNTTLAIARKIGWKDPISHASGDMIMKQSDENLEEIAITTSVFSRMFPEAKLKIINALKSSGRIVAMTGDGVNDGPALKAAHIGVAMGRRGTEIAKSSASLILKDDDLATMIDAISMGRRIHSNLKKAIRYIISIHIPIILIVSIPLILGWVYPNIFSPVHVITLELIMGPTCSIIFENEPIEKNLMVNPPKSFTLNFFNYQELLGSTIQGLAITIGALFMYHYALRDSSDEDTTRTLVFTTLVIANIFLTLVNRSFYYSIVTTLKYKNNLLILMLSLTIGLLAMMLFFVPVRKFFEFAPLSNLNLIICIVIGIASVIWYELVKLARRMHT
ncbi:MAG: cation-translocating P-type ATPase [Saprospiraceae bacterium]|nr:cation-translocating P-type ATPase [Saprospiraceae bacterium]